MGKDSLQQSWSQKDKDYHDYSARKYDTTITKEYAVYDKYYTIEKWVNQLKDAGANFILDFGCGTGRGTIPSIREGMSVCAVDHSIEMVKVVKEKAEKLGCKANCFAVVGDGQSLPFRDEAFEGIICQGVLHHIPNVDEAIKEQHRVLKRGGLLFIGEPNDEVMPFDIACHIIFRSIFAVGRKFLRIFGAYYPERKTDTERVLSGRNTAHKLEVLGFDCNITYIGHVPHLFRFLSLKMNYLIVVLVNKMKLSRNMFMIIGKKSGVSS